MASSTSVVENINYHCNYCTTDCSGLRVSCAECPDFDACVQCFASGAEMGHHKREHDYRFVNLETYISAYSLYSNEYNKYNEYELIFVFLGIARKGELITHAIQPQN